VIQLLQAISESGALFICVRCCSDAVQVLEDEELEYLTTVLNVVDSTKDPDVAGRLFLLRTIVAFFQQHPQAHYFHVVGSRLTISSFTVVSRPLHAMKILNFWGAENRIGFRSALVLRVVARIVSEIDQAEWALMQILMSEAKRSSVQAQLTLDLAA
jgi:hypothetical protein